MFDINGVLWDVHLTGFDHIEESKKKCIASPNYSPDSPLDIAKCASKIMGNKEATDHVLVPCGHTFCEQCANHLQHNKCHYCRTMVQKKVKMFIGTDSS